MAVNDAKQDLDFNSGWDIEDDHDYIYDEKEAGFTRRMDMDEFRHVLQTADRYALSDDVTSLMANQILAIVNRSDKCVSPSLINKWRKETAKKITEEYDETNQNHVCLTIDGKICDVNIGHNQTERKHVLTFVTEPACKYIDHLECGETGRAMSVANMTVISETNSLESLTTIGGDSTAANTGKHHGMIRETEVLLERPLQWKICQMHFAELPAKNLFIKLDGKTDGPLGPSGPIGKAIKNINKNLKPFVDFERVPSNVPEINNIEAYKQRQDLMILLDLIRALESGIVDPIYLMKKLPAMHNARWFTTFIRIIRLYMQTENPSYELKLLINFIQKE